MRHVILDRWARQSSLVHRRDPRAKIVALLVLLVALATAGRGLPLFSGALFLLLVAGFWWARIPWWTALARAAIVLPFTAIFVAMSWLAGDPQRAAALAIKSYLSALAVLWLIATTPLPSLLHGIDRMGAPRLLIEVAQFLYRYLFVIVEEGQLINRAASARGTSVRQWMAGRQRFRMAAGALAVLFSRSYGRAEHIHRAMLSRGFQGRLPSLEPARFRRGDLLFATLASLALVVLRVAAESVVR